MELKKQRDVVSVRLLDVVVSESELSVYDAALAYLLANLRERDCLKVTGATREEIVGMQEDIRNILQSTAEAVAGSTKGRYSSRRKTGTGD
jgi:hypothetical protein